MRGRIWVESEVGRGSTFHFIAVFELPAATKPARAKPSALEGLRVLVVDDNATNRHILEEMLASWHMRPTVASDATSAMSALRLAATSDQRFDAVILDGQMPDVDGFTLARRIRRDRDSRAHPDSDAHLNRARRTRSRQDGRQCVPEQAGQALRPARRADPRVRRVDALHARGPRTAACRQAAAPRAPDPRCRGQPHQSHARHHAVEEARPQSHGRGERPRGAGRDRY